MRKGRNKDSDISAAQSLTEVQCGQQGKRGALSWPHKTAFEQQEEPKGKCIPTKQMLEAQQQQGTGSEHHKNTEGVSTTLKSFLLKQ